MRGRLWGLTGGLALLLSGCYSYPYYGSPYGAPGSMYGTPYQQAPGGYVAPGGTYVPSNSNGISPTPVSPGTGSGVNTPPTFRPDGNAPAYPSNNVDKPVPRPDASEFGTDPNRTPQDNGFPASQFQPSSALPTGPQTVAAGPLPGNPSAMPMPVEQVRGQVADGVEYGYDANGYRWLKGLLTYDDLDKTWSVIYSLSPSAADRFGGEFTLAPDTRLDPLRNDTPVQIEGFIDEQTRDRQLNKPMYRITKILPLTR